MKNKTIKDYREKIAEIITEILHCTKWNALDVICELEINHPEDKNVNPMESVRDLKQFTYGFDDDETNTKLLGFIFAFFLDYIHLQNFLIDRLKYEYVNDGISIKFKDLLQSIEDFLESDSAFLEKFTDTKEFLKVMNNLMKKRDRKTRERVKNRHY